MPFQQRPGGESDDLRGCLFRKVEGGVPCSTRGDCHTCAWSPLSVRFAASVSLALVAFSGPAGLS